MRQCRCVLSAAAPICIESVDLKSLLTDRFYYKIYIYSECVSPTEAYNELDRVVTLYPAPRSTRRKQVSFVWINRYVKRKQAVKYHARIDVSSPRLTAMSDGIVPRSKPVETGHAATMIFTVNTQLRTVAVECGLTEICEQASIACVTARVQLP